MSEPHAPGERGRDGAALTLYLPSGPEGGGFLHVRSAEGVNVTVKCTPAHAHVLLALDHALRDDGDLLPEVRGWRRPGQLADAVATVTGYTIEAQTVRAYLSQIRRLVRQAAEASCPGLPVPPLFEHKRHIGVRLADGGLQVVGPHEAV